MSIIPIPRLSVFRLSDFNWVTEPHLDPDLWCWAHVALASRLTSCEHLLTPSMPCRMTLPRGRTSTPSLPAFAEIRRSRRTSASAFSGCSRDFSNSRQRLPRLPTSKISSLRSPATQLAGYAARRPGSGRRGGGRHADQADAHDVEHPRLGFARGQFLFLPVVPVDRIP